MANPSFKVFTDTIQPERAKQLEKARANYRNNLKRAPNDIGSLHILGLIECQLGHPAAAEKWLKRALAVKPDSPEILCHYALTLMERGMYEDTAELLQRALALNPKYIDAVYHLANANNFMGNGREALQYYQQTLELNPNHVDAMNSIGVILNDADMHQEALGYFQRAIKAQPTFAPAYNNMGLSLVGLDMIEKAEEAYRNAMKLRPEYSEAHNNLGITYRLRGNFAESLKWFRKALEIRGEYPEALNNLGNALKDSNDLEGAIVAYEKAIELKPSADYNNNLAHALLTAGRLKEGFKQYEWRWKAKQLSAGYRAFQKPLWLGEPAEGKTILLHAEQGFGDTLQFCRYVPLVAERGLRIIMEVQPALVRLMKMLPGVENVIAQGDPLPDFDLHCPLLSLPHAFGTEVATIPAPISYLRADETDIAVWAERVAPYKNDFKVGLVWAGKPQRHSPDLTATDRRRSVTPDAFKPLLIVTGTKFFSLQKGEGEAAAALGLIDLMEHCNDFGDTAAWITNLDLVITVDTAVAHLAAALGKPVWILNRFDSCWRWLRNRSDSPWYPKVRLFNQARPGDWNGVIEAIRTALASRQ